MSSVRSRAPDLLPLLDIVSYARKGPGRRARFDPGQIQQISRTVRRTPEVMVKVTGGGRSVGAVATHFAYISGQGKLPIDVDDGRQLEKDEEKELLKSWHLELTERPGRCWWPGFSRSSLPLFKTGGTSPWDNSGTLDSNLA